jgi:hypothetical protein
MVRFLPVLLGLVLAIYAVIDCIQAREDLVRGLPKIVWVFVILLFPLVGSIAWFVAGRPQRAQIEQTQFERWQDHARDHGYKADPPHGPDDDPDFLKGL